jgi:enoyl-CoA hydratase/carnithine racemase
MEATYETLEVTREDGILWVTMNRPRSLNALSLRMIDELADVFGSVGEDLETRVVILRGAGKAFCAGIDLKEESSGEAIRGTVETGLRSQRRVSQLVVLMRRAPQPVIAAVHGAAAGGGFSLMLASDIRVAADTARMNCAYIRVGLGGCDVGSSYFLPRIVGASVAAELILTGNFIDAARAERVGLVSRIVSESELEETARGLANDVMRNTPIGVQLSKECLNFSIDAPSLESAQAMEDRNQILCAQSGDFREGIQAFLEKRAPKYRGR